MEEQIMENAAEVATNVVEVAQKKGILNKENGILVLAAIGASTIVYGGYKGGKYLYRRFVKKGDVIDVEAKSVEE